MADDRLTAAAAAVLDAASALGRLNHVRELLEARLETALLDLHRAVDPVLDHKLREAGEVPAEFRPSIVKDSP